MPRMSRGERDAFLEKPLVAVFSTQRPDGTLHSTPVWFEHEGGTFFFWIDQASVKGRNLRHNPEASVCIATQSEPYQYVSVSGRCEVHEAPSSERCLSIARRYYGEERARAFVQEDLAAQETLIVSLKPRRWTTEGSA